MDLKIFCYSFSIAVLASFSPFALAAQSECATDSFNMHYSFAEESAKLANFAELSDTDAENRSVDKLFKLVSKLSSEIESCGDSRLPRLFNEAISFLFLLNHEDERLLELYEAFLTTPSLTSTQYASFSDNFYKMNWQARNFKKLPKIIDQYPLSEKVVADYPVVIAPTDLSNKMVLQASFSPTSGLQFSSANLNTDTLQLVVIIEQTCGFSLQLLDDLRKNNRLLGAPKDIFFVFPQSSSVTPLELARLSSEFKEFRFGYVNDKTKWPDSMFFHHYPMFYFLRGNEAVESIQGWPSSAQAEVVNQTFTRLQADVK